MINFLRSEDKYLPRDVNTDVKIRLYNEFKFWGTDVGSEQEMSLLTPDQQRLTTKMLNSPPKIEASKPQESLNMWKNLQPLTIEKILKKSKINIDFDDKDFEFKEVKTENAIIQCQFKKGTDEKQGIGRIVATKGKFDTSIQEGLFINNQLNGFGRIIYLSGNYYEGMIQYDKYQGIGKFVHKSGRVEEGTWESNKFIAPLPEQTLTSFD